MNLATELKVAARSLRKSPTTSFLAIAVLGLGIGANSTMFSLVNTIVLRPLEVPEPERLTLVLRHDTENRDYDSVSYPDFVDLKDGLRTFEDLTAHTMSMAGVGEGNDTKRTFVDVVAANYLKTFGVVPALGRAFIAEEEQPDARIPVAMLSYNYWQRLGGEQNTIGSQIVVNGIHTTVVGVTPKGFSGTSVLLGSELYLPLGMLSELSRSFADGAGKSLAERESQQLMLIGRLKAGISKDQANADLQRVSAALEEQFPATNRKVVYEAHPPSRVSISTGPQDDNALAPFSAFLMAMALIVLGVAGFNLAAVQGARNLSRRREIAIRLALGSGRLQIVRQLVLESLLLAVAGGLLGLAIAVIAPTLLAASMIRMMPFDLLLSGQLDWRIVLATFGFAVLAALFVSLLPALRATRPDLTVDLKEGRGQGATGKRRFGMARGDLPVIFELALSMVLLVCAGLFVKSALMSADVDPGFSVDNQLLVEIDPSLIGYDQQRSDDIRARLRTRFATVPGVRQVAFASSTPFGIVSYGERVVNASAPKPEGDQKPGEGATLYMVSDGYFSTLEIPVLRGREFKQSEPNPVVIIDEVLARDLFGETQVVGRQVTFFNSNRIAGDTEAEVIGVVASVRDSLFSRDERAHVYLPADGNSFTNSQFHVATMGPPNPALLQAVRAVTREVDAELPLITLRTFRDYIDSSFEVWTLRTGGQMFGIFAAVALLLAVAGVYGVQAFRMAQRTREIGLRMALGATFRDTVSLVLRDGLRVAVIGTTLGLALAAGMAQLLRAVLVDVSSTDPTVLIVSWTLLVAVACAACLLPARRAARLNPLHALREE